MSTHDDVKTGAFAGAGGVPPAPNLDQRSRRVWPWVLAAAIIVLVVVAGALFRMFSGLDDHVLVAQAFLDDVAETGTSDRGCPDVDVSDETAGLTGLTDHDLRNASRSNGTTIVTGTVVIEGDIRGVRLLTSQAGGEPCIAALRTQ